MTTTQRHHHAWTVRVHATEWTVDGYYVRESCPCGAATASLLTGALRARVIAHAVATGDVVRDGQ